MKNILDDLYNGKISAWERRRIKTAEENAINRKIEDEKRYFLGKMSLDDVQRFQTLENLYTQAHEFSEVDVFHYGFKLGIMLMCAVVND